MVNAWDIFMISISQIEKLKLRKTTCKCTQLSGKPRKSDSGDNTFNCCLSRQKPINSSSLSPTFLSFWRAFPDLLIQRDDFPRPLCSSPPLHGSSHALVTCVDKHLYGITREVEQGCKETRLISAFLWLNKYIRLRKSHQIGAHGAKRHATQCLTADSQLESGSNSLRKWLFRWGWTKEANSWKEAGRRCVLWGGVRGRCEWYLRQKDHVVGKLWDEKQLKNGQCVRRVLHEGVEAWAAGQRGGGQRSFGAGRWGKGPLSCPAPPLHYDKGSISLTFVFSLLRRESSRNRHGTVYWLNGCCQKSQLIN